MFPGPGKQVRADPDSLTKGDAEHKGHGRASAEPDEDGTAAPPKPRANP